MTTTSWNPHAENPAYGTSERGTGSEAITGATVSDAERNIDVNPKLAKNFSLLIERAKLFQATGHADAGQQLLISAIKLKNWGRQKLWWHLVAMMRSADDYTPIRNLWLSSPPACQDNVSILRAVARAAAVSGNHDDCRVLLRKAIMLLGSRPHSESLLSRWGKTLRLPLLYERRAAASTFSSNSFAKDAALALADLNRAFADIGLKTFLISGTLLGQVREGRIIGWDKDIDIGFFSEDCHTDLESWFAGSELFRLGRVDFTSDRIRAIHRNGTWIDIFPHRLENGRRWHDGTATRWWNTPFGLRAVNFLGVNQHIPDDPERYLDENYGDWRTPNSHFDARIDAPNVEITDPEHFVSLLYFSLEKSVRKNQDVMMHRYIELLREQGEGAWLDKLHATS